MTCMSWGHILQFNNWKLFDLRDRIPGHDRIAYRQVCCLDDTLFPLTPALSPRERENRAPVFAVAMHEVCAAGVAQQQAVARCSLSDRKRVRVKRITQGQSSVIQRTPQRGSARPIQ